ncbi:MAG: hypothetical protein PWP04_618 [Candidatus Atribacteria bacterium]|nr:hypothetical protein [Candidatus Atribacteria bacterium]
MEQKEYKDVGIKMVMAMDLEEKTKEWPWLLDKRIRRKFVRPEEEEKYIQSLKENPTEQ